MPPKSLSRPDRSSILANKTKMEALRLMLHDSPHPGYIKNRYGCYMIVNTAASSLFFMRPFDIEGRYDYEFMEEPTLSRVREADAAVLRSGRHSSTTTTLFTPNYNTERLWVISRWPLRETDGRVVGVVCAARDITGHDAGSIAESGAGIVETTIGATLTYLQQQIASMGAEMTRIEATLKPGDTTFASLRKTLAAIALAITNALRASRPRSKRH